MAWRQTGGGQVKVVPSEGDPFWLIQTSLCTVNLAESNGQGTDQLRMFGIDPAAVGFSSSDGSRGDFITFLDAIPPSDRTQKFEAWETPDGTKGKLWATGIPARKNCRSWYYTIVYYGTSAPPTEDYDSADVEEIGNGVWHIHNQLACMDVWYKDPAVVHLPDGKGWLMILTRARWVREGECTQGRGECGSGMGELGSGPNDCLSDIVCYWAEEDDPGFASVSTIGPVTGPYWLAVNTGSLGPDTEGIRFWLSVPGGAMVSPHTLAVYFVAEATSYAEGVKGSESDRNHAFDGIAWADRSNAERFVSAIGVHLIELDELERMKDPANPLYGNEEVWSRNDDATNWRAARTASTVYLWSRAGDSAGPELLDDADAATVKFVDPQCARCSTDPLTIGFPEYVRLFLATNGRDETGTDPGAWVSTASPLHGLLVARAMEYNEFDPRPRREPNPQFFFMEPGIDFLLIRNKPFVEADFDTGDSERTYLKPVDPDPVRQLGGTWRVGFGVLYPGDNQEDSEVLPEVTASDSAVCSADAAWAYDPPVRIESWRGLLIDWSPV